MRIFRAVSLLLVISMVASCGASSQQADRTRNNGLPGQIGYDGYLVPASVAHGVGYSTVGPSSWDSKTYDTGEGRIRAASPVYETVGPAVPPRPHRPTSTPPPIYERVVSQRGSVTPTVASGTSMKTGNIAKLMGGLGNMGAMMAGSIAAAGLGMALSAMGAPPFLTALFGGGDSATAEALAAIQKTLAEMNAKLDTIINKIDDLQVSVDQVNSSLQLMSSSQCAGNISNAMNTLSTTIPEIERLWNGIYRDAPSQFGTTGSTIPALTKSQKNYFTTYSAGIKNLRPLEKITFIENMFIGPSSEVSDALRSDVGLLGYIQRCTLAEQRFLTNDDTARWQAIATMFMVYQGRAAQLATFAEVFDSMMAQPAQPPSITELNLISLTLRSSMARMGFSVSMQIPEGQVLDTVTNKMWRNAPSGQGKVALVDALKACLPDEDRFINYAPVPSWNGYGTRDLNQCVATHGATVNPTGAPLDMSPWGSGATLLDNSLWRLPAAHEITAGGNTFNAPSGSIGLLDRGTNKSGTTFGQWKDSMCGIQRAVKCSTPGSYLQTFGAAGNAADLSTIGIVWTNTSYHSIGWGGGGPFTGKVAEKFNSTWSSGATLSAFCENTSPAHVGMIDGATRISCGAGGFADPRAIARALGFRTDVGFSVPSTVLGQPKGQTLDNFCFRVSTAVTKGGHTANEWSSPLHAEVAVLNLGVRGTNTPSPDKKTTGVNGLPSSGYRAIDPGGWTSYFANRAGVDGGTFACSHGWFASTVTRLPQTAQALWVRDLASNESYYSLYGTTGPTGVSPLKQFQASLEAPTVSIFGLNGDVVINRQLTDDSRVVCMLDPSFENDPLVPEDVINQGTRCSSVFADLTPGLHRVYAVGYREVGRVAVMSPIEISDFYISQKIADTESTTSVSGTGNESVSTSTSATAALSINAEESSLPLGYLLSRAGIKIKSGEKTKIKIAKASQKICRATSISVVGLRPGKCKMTLQVLSVKGKKKTKKLSVNVTS